MVPSSDTADRAKRSLAEFLAQAEDAVAIDFEGWVAARPELATELRRLHEECTRIDRMLSSLAADSHTLDSVERELRAGSALPDAELVAELDALGDVRFRSERYELLEPVDRGGMGIVLRVHDRVLARDVAMKRVRASGRPEPRRVKRFLAEAKLAARLDHPGIVPIHDLGVDAQGGVFFTMPLVRGSTLDDVFERVARGEDGWTLARALEVVLKVCDAVGYAHSANVVHRDLKPRNVMVGRFGEAYVMDWGLAHVLGGERDPAIVGTPDYMAPEQAAGDVERVGPRSDVYSVGAILAQLLAVAAEVPPVELSAIAAQAMAQDPAQRYADMRAMADDLRAYLAGRVVRAHERGAWPELKKWLRRNRALSASALGTMFVAIGGLLALSWVEARGKAEVLQLADNLRLSELEREADRLWPATPERVAAMQAWRERASALSANRARHERALARLGSEESVEARWRRDGLEALIAGIDRLAEPERGLLADVERRIALASRIERVSLVEHAAQWERACASIADASECPQYRGLRIRPQLGLVPIGRDPASGLWEFRHVASDASASRDDADRVSGGGIVLVLVPGGAATLGSERPIVGHASGPRTDPLARDDEPPTHVAALAPFFLSKYELARAQWRRLEDPAGRDVASDSRDGEASLPAASISWTEAQRALAHAALRLPTAEEWEYAARAGTETRWWWGNDAASLLGAANVGSGLDASLPFDDRFKGVAPVDALAPNPFGFVNVHGNVAEWTSTESATQGEFLVRGGGWRSSIADARAASRAAVPAENRSADIGVRAARSLDP